MADELFPTPTLGLDPLDVGSVLPPQAPPQAPAQPQVPTKPTVAHPALRQAALAALVPFIAKRGGPMAVSALINGFQQAEQAKLQRDQQFGQTQFENQRQAEQDQRAQVAQQSTDQYRAQTLQGQTLKEAMAALQNAESPEAIGPLLALYKSRMAQLGMRDTGALDQYAAQMSAPSRVERKAAETYIGKLEKTYGQDWASKVGSATFTVPGIAAPVDPSTGKTRGLTTQELLGKAGLSMDGLPVKPPTDRHVVPGSFEDFSTEADPAKRAKILADRKLYGQADDRGLAPPITINLPGMSPEEKVTTAAQAIREGRMAPSQLTTFFAGMGQNSEAKLRDAVMAQILRDDPKFNFAGAESNYQFGKSSGTQTTVRYIDNIAKTVPMLRTANQSLKRSNIQIVNGAIQSTKSQIGNVDVADFNFKLTLLADEIAKVLQGGGTGSGTSDAKLRQAQTLLSGRMSSAQLDTVLDAAQDMLKVRRDSLSKGTFMEGGPTPATPDVPPQPKPNPFKH